MTIIADLAIRSQKQHKDQGARYTAEWPNCYSLYCEAISKQTTIDRTIMTFQCNTYLLRPECFASIQA